MVGSETLTLVRQARGKHGDPAGAATEIQIPGCIVWPRTSTETTDAQDTVITGYSALLPPGSDVTSTDRLRWRGLLFDVVGEPGIYTTPFSGTDPGLEVSMRRVTG